MRVMLNKLPEGDWLCEECSTKHSEASKVEKIEILPESNQKLGSSLGLKGSDTSRKEPVEKSEFSATPSKKSILSRESSSKSLDSGHIKPMNNVMLSSSSPVVSRSLDPSLTSKTQGQPSRGNFVPFYL